MIKQNSIQNTGFKKQLKAYCNYIAMSASKTQVQWVKNTKIPCISKTKLQSESHSHSRCTQKRPLADALDDALRCTAMHPETTSGAKILEISATVRIRSEYILRVIFTWYFLLESNDPWFEWCIKMFITHTITWLHGCIYRRVKITFWSHS